jgi:hypothetical protein
MGDPQINGFQMLVGNLCRLDFGFGSLPPTACGGFQNWHGGTVTAPRLPKIQTQPNSGESVKIELSQRDRLLDGVLLWIDFAAAAK